MISYTGYDISYHLTVLHVPYGTYGTGVRTVRTYRTSIYTTIIRSATSIIYIILIYTMALRTAVRVTFCTVP